jgi:hybrid cluster-associated redox disulfide protein
MSYAGNLKKDTAVGPECQLPPLTLSMPVQEIVRQWPQSIPIFIKYRMSCVGCSLEAFESLAQALSNYTIPAEVFLEELCAAIRAQSAGEQRK